MPGVANFLTAILTRALSLQDVEGASTQALFVTLDAQVDASVYALETAPDQASFAAAQQQYAPVFSTFGDDGTKLGAEMGSEAVVFGLADMLLRGHAGGAAHADLSAFDKQMLATAHDFSALGVDIKSLGTITQDGLMGAVTNLAGDSSALASDFTALSASVATVAHDFSTHGSPLAGLGTAMQPLGAEYAAIATDFSNMYALYTGATTSSTGDPLTFNGVFKSLDTDLITLDNSMHGVAAPMADAMLAQVFGGGRRC